jgi:hypothetical protein
MDKDTLKTLTDFRKTLHQYPEVSGEEKETAKRVLGFFPELKPQARSFKNWEVMVWLLYMKEKKMVQSLYTVVNWMDCLSKKKTTSSISALLPANHMFAVMMDIWPSSVDWVFIFPKIRHQKVKLFYCSNLLKKRALEQRPSSRIPKFKSIKPDYAFALHNLPYL